jgi:HSP20 family protein
MQTLFVSSLRDCQPEPWRPAADVYRTPHGWLVKLEVAGFSPGQLEVEARGNHLVVRGCRRDTCRGEGVCHYHLEIAYSRFERRFELPAQLEESRITTEYCDGMLYVNIALTETE